MRNIFLSLPYNAHKWLDWFKRDKRVLSLLAHSLSTPIHLEAEGNIYFFPKTYFGKSTHILRLWVDLNLGSPCPVQHISQYVHFVSSSGTQGNVILLVVYTYPLFPAVPHILVWEARYSSPPPWLWFECQHSSSNFLACFFPLAVDMGKI